MNTNFELEMPDEIFNEWDTYTNKQKKFLMYLLSEKYDQTEAYIAANYSKAGAKTNSYKVLANLKVVWDWMQYWKAHTAASEGVVTKNEMLQRYSEMFKKRGDDELSVGNLLKVGKEIAALCVYYPDAKQDMAKKNLEMQNLIETKNLPLDVRKAMMLAIRANKEEEQQQAKLNS